MLVRPCCITQFRELKRCSYGQGWSLATVCWSLVVYNVPHKWCAFCSCTLASGLSILLRTTTRPLSSCMSTLLTSVSRVPCSGDWIIGPPNSPEVTMLKQLQDLVGLSLRVKIHSYVGGQWHHRAHCKVWGSVCWSLPGSVVCAPCTCSFSQCVKYC